MIAIERSAGQWREELAQQEPTNIWSRRKDELWHVPGQNAGPPRLRGGSTQCDTWRQVSRDGNSRGHWICNGLSDATIAPKNFFNSPNSSKLKLGPGQFGGSRHVTDDEIGTACVFTEFPAASIRLLLDHMCSALCPGGSKWTQHANCPCSIVHWLGPFSRIPFLEYRMPTAACSAQSPESRC